MAAVVRDLHFPKFRNPATTFHSLAPFHPPIICRANCAALVFSFVSCRSLTSSLTTPHGIFSWGTLSPVYQPGHGDITSPLYTAVTATATSRPLFTPRSNPVTATSRPRFTPRSRPQRHFGHVPRLRPARVTCQHLLLCGVLLAHRAP